jgi:hypothetical protein
LTKKEEKLLAQGWEKRFVACEPRLSEFVELYRSIGYEVHLEPLGEEEEGCTECTRCFERDREKYRVIFTRPRQETWSGKS